MKLKNDIDKENKKLFSDSLSILGKPDINCHLPTTAEKKKVFIENWLKCKATLSDWIHAVNVNVDELLQNSKLDKKKKSKILKQQRILYDKYIEDRTLRIMEIFNIIVKTVPY